MNPLGSSCRVLVLARLRFAAQTPCCVARQLAYTHGWVQPCQSLTTLYHSQPPGKGQKMMQFLNYRMKITMTDLRTIIGTFLAYDKHMNLVLVSNHWSLVSQRPQHRAP